MKKQDPINHYLSNYAAGNQWQLVAGSKKDFLRVVVIPAYAEKELLFSTLVSLARNPRPDLKDTFILCVVNNKMNAPETVRQNNRQTMQYLDLLVAGKNLANYDSVSISAEEGQLLQDAGLNIGYINASSPGLEIPENTGGVGMARKIGMDMALRLLPPEDYERRLIISLDADTLVRDNYLREIQNHFQRKINTAVVAYEHQNPQPAAAREAICYYEIFLRYWVLGLQYADSPYAFHSIGSTIVCTAGAYLAVRGMNRREAGEDFYFLNKLAKTGKIGYIRSTCVYPSARISGRVPFGTGKAMQRRLEAEENEYCLYDPEVFAILKQWLQIMKNPGDLSSENIMQQAAAIHPALAEFLKINSFASIWLKIRHNANDEKVLTRQFHDWFDGFKTLKLINYLSREPFPRINMFKALSRFFAMDNQPDNDLLFAGCNSPEIRLRIINNLRKRT